MDYAKKHETSIKTPDTYWNEQAKHVAWYKEPETILSTNSEDWNDWYADGELNTSYLALDYHLLNTNQKNLFLVLGYLLFFV